MKLPFEKSYLGKLRSSLGHQVLMVPGFRMVIENRRGEVLFIKRADNGFWALPAGSPELQESIEDCIYREVEEETSLLLTSLDCFGFASHPNTENHTYPNGDKIHNFSLLVYSTDWTGEPKVNDDETTEVRFFEPSKVPTDKVLKHEFGSVLKYFDFKKSGKFQWS